MLSVNKLDIRYGEKHLFKNISAKVHEGNRIGLIGVNGAGKSTLLKIMAAEMATDDGVVSRSKNFTVAYYLRRVVQLFLRKRSTKKPRWPLPTCCASRKKPSR